MPKFSASFTLSYSSSSKLTIYHCLQPFYIKFLHFSPFKTATHWPLHLICPFSFLLASFVYIPTTFQSSHRQPLRCPIMVNAEGGLVEPQVQKSFCILHFNDCYNVEPQELHEPIGGAARFVTALRTFKHLEPVVLFSGDILAPSIMSTFTKGEQMLPVLEECNVDCALFGNHEFDFGLDHLVSFAKKTKFPWLMSNVFMKDTTVPLGEGKVTHIIEKNGIKVGLIGLIEEEWLSTLVIDPNDIHYVNFITEGRSLAKSLRENDKVDIVIALTHMRTHNDIKLAENVDEIDLILGGHDHDYYVEKVNGKYIIKSGTDFRQFSKIDVTLSPEIGGVEVQIKAVDVTADFEEDTALASVLEQYNSVIEGKMEDVLAYVECDLDGKFASIRSNETNLGNLVADIMLDAVDDVDIALLNSGTLRSDRVHPKGPFKMRDLVTILPFMESILVIEMNGEQVHRALENGVSQYPKLEGRFPQVSGLRFSFDPSKPPGNRVPVESIKVGGQNLDLQRVYKVVTKEFIAQGKDGYDVLKDCPLYKSTEDCMPMTQAVCEYFEAMRRVQAQVIALNQHPSHRRQSLISISRRLSRVDPATLLDLCRLDPKVEGRITILQPSQN